MELNTSPILKGFQVLDMNDLKKAKQLFTNEGLIFPSIPGELAGQLKEHYKWLFSTRELKMTPYNLQYFLQECDEGNNENYALLAHTGHGINSYAIQYYLVYESLRMFLFLPWGGVYTCDDTATFKVNECFFLVDQIISMAMMPGILTDEKYLMVVAGGWHDSYWSLTDRKHQIENGGIKGSAEVLDKALLWLKSQHSKM